MADSIFSFWGVFWVDGRSHSHLEQSLSQLVAEHAKERSPNHRSALQWLAGQEERWLLIIDNADDPSLDLKEYFPRGVRGFVLITTRNPGYKSLGNVGKRYFEFDGLPPDEASELLLQTAGLTPMSDELSPVARAIVEALGYLALAISVAGSAISEGACQIQGYLRYFEDKWNDRQRLKDAKRRSSAALQEHFEQTRSVITRKLP